MLRSELAQLTVKSKVCSPNFKTILYGKIVNGDLMRDGLLPNCFTFPIFAGSVLIVISAYR